MPNESLHVAWLDYPNGGNETSCRTYGKRAPRESKEEKFIARGIIADNEIVRLEYILDETYSKPALSSLLKET
jgi:hypothetical protein